MKDFSLHLIVKLTGKDLIETVKKEKYARKSQNEQEHLQYSTQTIDESHRQMFWE